MAYLNWSADLETGIELVDQDHKVLVDLLNQVFDCLDDNERAVTLGSVLNALADYTQYHFTREERLMEAAHFPNVESHKTFHKALMGRTLEFKAAHARDPRGRGRPCLAGVPALLADRPYPEGRLPVSRCRHGPP